MIMTLVYNGGTILASKRAPYDDLVNDNFDEKKLAERLGRQHKLICAAVRAGRMDDLRQMSKKPSPAAISESSKLSAAITEPAISAPVPMTIGKVEIQRIVSVISPKAIDVVKNPEPAEIIEPLMEAPGSRISTEHLTPSEIYEDEFIFEGASIIEDEIVLEAGAVAVVSELSGIDRPANENLKLELLGDNKFKGGESVTFRIMVCRGTARKVIIGAQIMIKVLGSTFRPVILHAKTDSNGLANIHLQLPHFRSGRSALLVRAIADGEEMELRRVISPG